MLKTNKLTKTVVIRCLWWLWNFNSLKPRVTNMFVIRFKPPLSGINHSNAHTCPLKHGKRNMCSGWFSLLSICERMFFFSSQFVVLLFNTCFDCVSAAIVSINAVNVHFVLFPSDSEMCFQPVCWNYCSIGPLTDISWLLWTGRYANSHSNYFWRKGVWESEWNII